MIKHPIRTADPPSDAFLAIGIFAMLFWGMCEADKYVDISIREREFKLHDARDGGFSGMR